MRIARFSLDDEPTYGIVDGEHLIVLTGDPLYTRIAPTDRRVPLEEVRLLAPVIPRSKVVAFARTYPAHAAEFGNEVPAEPMMFLMPNTAVVGPDDPIVLPAWTENVDYEGELAVVISRLCKDVPAERAHEVILGYTCANDVSARDKQKSDGQWARAKGFDSACPLGPWIETELDPAGLELTTRRDGTVVQRGNTGDLVFDVATLVAYASRAFTLLPGDVICTGTPAGVGPIEAGQRIEVEISGIGTLSNPVVRR
ncbi:MAG: fumarylacetoacetate hydrolase family protein [Actinomycetales bacterium]